MVYKVIKNYEYIQVILILIINIKYINECSWWIEWYFKELGRWDQEEVHLLDWKTEIYVISSNGISY